MKVVKGNANDGGYELPNGIHIKHRELEILALSSHGLSNEEIAQKLHIKSQTVINNANNLMIKLRAKNRSQAVVISVGKGYLETDRDSTIETRKTKYLWCLHCERTYKRGEFKVERIKSFTVDHVRYDPGDFEMCPYPDCNGDAVLDAWEWEEIRKYNPGYPKIPQKDMVYPMYPQEDNKHE